LPFDYQFSMLDLPSNGDYGWLPNGGWYMKVQYKPGKSINQ